MQAEQSLAQIRIYANVSEIRKNVNVDKKLDYHLDSDQSRQTVEDATCVEGGHLLSHTITRKGNIRKCEADDENDEACCSSDVNFTFSQPEKVVLSSLVTSITWKPKYEITLKDKEPSLKCVAIIKNESSTKYLAEKAELFGGCVEKVDARINEDCDSDVDNYCEDCLGQDTSCSLSKLSDFKLAGVHKYSLPGQLCLKPNSSHYMEFMTAKVTVEQLSSLYLKNPRNLGRCFQSVYILKADKFLPKGIVCLRGADGLIGGADMNDLPAEQEQEIILGTDPRSYVKRKETYKDRQNKVCNIEVELSLSNGHDSLRTFRYKERYSRYDFIVSYNLSGNSSIAQKNENGIEILAEIWPGRTEVYRFTMERQRTLP